MKRLKPGDVAGYLIYGAILVALAVVIYLFLSGKLAAT